VGETPYGQMGVSLSKLLVVLGWLDLQNFESNLLDPSPPPFLEKSTDPLFISFDSFLWAFFRVVEVAGLVHLTFSPFSCVM
jgi:hypothetical protein